MDDQAIRVALERHWSDINNQDVAHVKMLSTDERLFGANWGSYS